MHFQSADAYKRLLLLAGVLKGKGRGNVATLTLEPDVCTGAERKRNTTNRSVSKTSKTLDDQPSSSAKPGHDPNCVEKESGTKATGARVTMATSHVEIPQDVPPPPSPSSEGGVRAKRTRVGKHERTYRWGPHTMSFIPPRSWRATFEGTLGGS
jgi:hypothetical protein